MRDTTHDPRPSSADRPSSVSAGAPATASERTVAREAAVERLSDVAIRPGLLEFRAEVARLARDRRTEGVGVERVIPEVRRLARAAASAAGVDDAADAVVVQAVRWSIEAYFDEPELRHVPRFY